MALFSSSPDAERPGPALAAEQACPAPIAILGVPFDNVSMQDALGRIEQMIRARVPHYLVTANVDFLVQAHGDLELRRLLFDAHLVLCDGTPVLWASRWLGNPLRERVAGSDLVPLLIEVAAQKGFRLFFLGGSVETTELAMRRLNDRYPELDIAGYYSPPFQDLLQMDHEEIRRRIQAARPDLLLVSFGCPKQEKWIGMHYRSLGVPVSIGVGATIDFLAGRISRAPNWMRQTGTEWIYRLAQEPRRLARRYLLDCCCFAGLLGAQLWRTRICRSLRPRRAKSVPPALAPSSQEIRLPEWLDAAAVQEHESLWRQLLSVPNHYLIDASEVKFVDSTGIGLIIRFRKHAARMDRRMILVSPAAAVQRALAAMQLSGFFETAPGMPSASALLESSEGSPTAFGVSRMAESILKWQGEVTAANADAVWRSTSAFISSIARAGASVTIDLSKVTFLDSTGIGLMVRSKKEAAKLNAILLFRGLSSDLKKVVRISKLEEYLFGPPPS